MRSKKQIEHTIMSQTVNSEVRLSDVLRIALPMTASVQLTTEQARKKVNWVTLVTSLKNTQVHSGDVALCPIEFQKQLSNSKFKELIQLLASTKVAALIVFSPLSSKLQAWANNIDIALIMLSKEQQIREVHKNIAALLLDHETQISERGMQLYRDLSEMSREGEGLQKMATLIAQVTGKIVTIQDKRLEVKAVSRPPGSLAIDEEDLFNALAEKQHLPPVLRNRKAAAKANKNHWQQLLFPHHNVARLIAPIISGDRARGYLSIIGEAGELDMLDSVAVEQGSSACALEMAKAKALSEVKKALRGNFLEGILAGTIPAQEIGRLASRLDHDTELPHAVLTFRWSNPDEISLRRIESTLHWLISTSNEPTMIHIYAEDHVAVFHSLRKVDDLGAALRLAKQLRTQLKSTYPKQRMEAGISGPALELQDWPQIHREALQAMEVGQRLHVNDIVEYNSLGVYRLLGQLDDVPVVHDFCDQVIGPLVEYDRDHRSNLVQTIEEFFNHHGNVSKTAEALFIHRNTLLYRLDRIQDLTEHNLDMSDMRLALHIALKLWQLRPET